METQKTCICFFTDALDTLNDIKESHEYVAVILTKENSKVQPATPYPLNQLFHK